MVRHVIRVIAMAVLSLIVLGFVAWGMLALWFDGPSSRVLAGTMCALIGFTSLLLAALVRPYSRGLLAAIFPAFLVAIWWVSIAPSNSRNWTPEVARTAQADFNVNGSSVTIGNVRNFKYRSESDYDQRWETRTYKLDQIRGIDLFLSYWGPTQIAHTIISWEFNDGQHLAISIETRKEKGESYSALRGFFRQYELYYVIADERDVIGVRTNFRAEQVYLYRVRISASQARALLVDYLNEINRLADQPQWYNALTQNCTTVIRWHGQNIGAVGLWDWRLLANGNLDQLLYERGWLDTGLPFDELRARSNITERARAAGDSPDFSTRIRVNDLHSQTPQLPGMALIQARISSTPSRCTMSRPCSGIITPVSFVAMRNGRIESSG
jgi:hypothetical protein